MSAGCSSAASVEHSVFVAAAGDEGSVECVFQELFPGEDALPGAICWKLIMSNDVLILKL